jgi:2-phospho-L-lactate guanylyltransferase
MSASAVLIPVKDFEVAKGRLAPELGASERAELARCLADEVVAACSDMAVFVVCESRNVEMWAESRGATVIQNPRPGLNHAVRHGARQLFCRGFDRVLIAHADLARPSALPELVELDGVVLVPDRHLDGTNAMVVPTGSGFSFSYGPGSFARHLSEAERLGLPVHVVRGVGLDLDLDDPADLALYRRSAPVAGSRGSGT